MFETLEYSLTDQLATITFNRPDAMNAFNKTMAHELKALTEQVKADESIRAVVLKGAGKLFMAGGDIRFFYETLDVMPKGVLGLVRLLNASVLNLMTMPKPVLASVHGSVAGAGVSIMMGADIIIAEENTQFTLAYSGIGVSPDGGATYNLPRLVGCKKAMEWLLLSDIFDAKTAALHGLINFVAPKDQLPLETARLANRLATGPTQTFSHIKRLVRETWHTPLEEQLEQEGFAFEASTATADFREGVTQFLQKKKPVFTGE